MLSWGTHLPVLGGRASGRHLSQNLRGYETEAWSLTPAGGPGDHPGSCFLPAGHSSRPRVWTGGDGVAFAKPKISGGSDSV